MTEFQKYIQQYLDLLSSENWKKEMEISGEKTLEIYENLSEMQSEFSYAERKWSLKELLQHLIDAERIFVYRALRFSRKDATELAGWDEENYAKHYFPRTLESLISEFRSTRNSSILFFENLNNIQLAEKGIANNNEVSVETIGKLIVGHNLHHLNIIEKRYLITI